MKLDALLNEMAFSVDKMEALKQIVNDSLEGVPFSFEAKTFEDWINGEENELTGDADDSLMIFSTIVNLIESMMLYLKKNNAEPDVLLVGALRQEGHDRAGFYRKLITRLSSKIGFKPGANRKLETFLKSEFKKYTKIPHDLQFLSRA